MVQGDSALLTEKGGGERKEKCCSNSSLKIILVKCKISMRKNTFHTFRKPESVFLTSRFITTSFLQTRMSCHCLWSNFLYGHFCLLRFSTLIRLGRSKIREILTEYIAPPASRGRRKDNPSSWPEMHFSDILHLDHVAFLHVRVHCETQELDVELICEGTVVRILDATSPEWILLTQIGCASFAFEKKIAEIKGREDALKSITNVKFIDIDSL